jgi:A/G-specific adenine glycosylase
LLEWFGEVDSKRQLPWKDTDDPYAIWISEIILQQTQVKQGLSYYENFISTFPTVYKLAEASEEEVLSCWKGLGYYSRARNLHSASRYIVEELNGQFPNNYQDLLRLKGVGPYSAAAIASFAFKEAKAVVDGNVYRVLGRCFGIDLETQSTKGKKHYQSLADALLHKEKPDKYNQAIMDFGALVCKPNRPNCDTCPLNIECHAYQTNTVNLFPVKKAKTKRKVRFLHFLIIKTPKGYVMERRTANDIWKGLYQFPCVESDSDESLPKIQWHESLPKLISELLSENTRFFKQSQVKQLLTHQEIRAVFYICDQEITESQLEDLELIDETGLKTIAMPKLIDEVVSKTILK